MCGTNNSNDVSVNHLAFSSPVTDKHSDRQTDKYEDEETRS